MKFKISVSIISFFLILNLNAQDEASTFCSKRDRFKIESLKSNSLSAAQIAETEKYDVHFYSLDVALTHLSTSIAGTVEIHASAKQNLDSVLFELFQTMNISEIRVNNIPVNFSRNLSAVKAPLQALQGELFVLSIDYSGTPPNATTNPLGGSGMSNASSPNWGNQVTWSLSEPFSAYEWWPCKQSLTDKADSCEVKITVPDSCMAGSNGVLLNVENLGNGSVRYEWKHNHPIDYYLISVAVAEYVEYNVYANPIGSPSPVLIQNFIYDNPETLINFQTDIEETASFLELYANLFGPYPFDNEKYGHCMAPISGGMEHQTMTTQGWFEKSLTSHELAHQWFGNNVTCASWKDIWINEGFASYAEYLMLENLYPLEKNQKMLDVHSNVMSSSSGSVYVLDSLNEGRIFNGRLTYDKGSAIIHTMRFVLNDDNAFFNVLKNFQNHFNDSVAKGTDFKSELEAISGIDFTNIFDDWYFGQGYPTYSTRWNSIGNDLHLEINHYSSAPSITPTFRNPLEIKFTRSGLTDTIVRFDIDDNTNNFIVSGIGQVTGVSSIDPNNWIINKKGNNTYDPNFTASLNNLSMDFAIKLYPNPAKEYVTLTSKKGNFILTISDSKGLIINKISHQDSTHIDLTNLSPGLYFVTVTESDYLYDETFKLTIH